MKTIMFLLCSLILAGCCATNTNQSSIIQPQLLEICQLPAVPASIHTANFEINTDMLINEEGNVVHVKFLKGSGDSTWDSLAVKSIMSWKFSPALLGDKPIRTLIRRKIKLLFEEPVFLSLAEILCKDKADADSVYAALERGEEFGSLAEMYSISNARTNKGVLGSINICRYTLEIQSVLKRLDENEYSKPIVYGKNYIIFKKLKM